MLSVLDPLLGTFFELLKNKFLTWIASGGTKVDESRKLGVVVSGKFGYSGRLRAPAMHGVSSINTPVVNSVKRSTKPINLVTNELQIHF